MRSSKNSSEFFTRMKKKPDLQKILDNFDTYSIEDLEKVKQPKWIKKHLVNLKNQGNKTGYLSPMEIAAVMTKAGENKPIKISNYKVYRFVGDTSYFDGVEILQNELLLVIDDKKVKAGFTEIDIEKISSNLLQFVSEVLSVKEYNEMVLNENWKNYGFGDRVVTEENSKEKNFGLFKIRRID